MKADSLDLRERIVHAVRDQGLHPRLVVEQFAVGPDRTTDPAMATRLTMTFTPTPDDAQLDLTHDRLDGLRDRYPHIAEQVGPGWESALDAFVAVGW